MVALVLLPGLDGTGLLFEDFTRAVAGAVETSVIAYPADRFLGYVELEQWVRSSLPTEQPFFLLGESFSGPIALAIAASPPPNMRGLILCCSFAHKPLPMATLLARLLPLIPIREAPLKPLKSLLLGRFASERGRQLLGGAIAHVEFAVLKRRAEAALRVDVSALLPAIKLPLLYLRASEDRVIGRRCFMVIKGLLPSTQIVEMEAPHFLLQVIPELAASVITDFISAQTTKVR